MPFVAENSKNLDGGFIYVNQPSGSPARGPMAGESKDEAMKSYGSMTYAGLKSMAYAGLTKEDKRVKAAFDWMTKHYTVTENPGKGAAGLFYYYHSMAKALAVLDLPLVEAADGKKHDWRKDLTEQLVSQQKEDGSWTNEKSRQYMENDPNLATGYALLVLGLCKK
jgi:squalene-hopene/tetraprenyl-beta-curcumene cyclase